MNVSGWRQTPLRNKEQRCRLHWTIFCQVIDNLGDIGVSWRLARQLRHDFGQHVTLWVDDLGSLQRIAPQVNRYDSNQCRAGVHIRQWRHDGTFGQSYPSCLPGDVVIEMFGCNPPDDLVHEMARQPSAPVWINLEYLSAEPWVADYHGLPSPHPRLPLTKTFFFPGFVRGTGGLLRENDLMQLKTDFDTQRTRQFWHALGLPQRVEDECRISLFCYEHAPLATLIAAWEQSPQPVLLIVPEGPVAENVADILNVESQQGDGILRSGQLSVKIIPFLEQTRYDLLLWACDLNFVRGEDSFVRAQWAGKPFVWQIYPQSDGAHAKKLNAFLTLYTQKMPANAAHALEQFWHGWNGLAEIGQPQWQGYHTCLNTLKDWNADWLQQLQAQQGLASNLVQFVRNRL